MLLWALPINPFTLLNLAELSLHAAYFIKKCGIVPPVFYAEHRRLGVHIRLGGLFTLSKAKFACRSAA
jgi:hypothetical protein